MIAALLAPGSMTVTLGQAPAWLGVVGFALIGLPLYVCASGATPLAAGLVAAGASPGAAVAMLLAGPATNVTTFGVLGKLHGRRIALIFGASVVIMAIVCGWSVDAALGAEHAIPALERGHEHAGWWQWASLAALGLMVAASLARMGPRSWLQTVMSFGGHDHDHDHGEGESEGCGGTSDMCSGEPSEHEHDHDHDDDHAEPHGADGVI